MKYSPTLCYQTGEYLFSFPLLCLDWVMCKTITEWSSTCQILLLFFFLFSQVCSTLGLWQCIWNMCRVTQSQEEGSQVLSTWASDISTMEWSALGAGYSHILIPCKTPEVSNTPCVFGVGCEECCYWTVNCFNVGFNFLFLHASDK